VTSELGRLDQAAALADELLESRAELTWLPGGIELAWTAEQLGTTERVRAWTESIAMRSTWNEAGLALLDARLEDAADLFEEIGALTDEARTRVRAAERLIAGGSSADAEVQLRSALEFYRSVGATAYIRVAESLMAGSA